MSDLLPRIAPFDCAEIRHVRLNKHLFTDGFAEWLAGNWHIWKQFERQADILHKRGFSHYSARTIIEWMRHNTALSERDGSWKLNNNVCPDLARLYMVMRPEWSNFFEFRVMPSSKRAA